MITHQRARSVLLTAVGLVAIACAVKGFGNALGSSQDFQWSPAHLFTQGENPYTVYRDGTDRILLYQAPNYLHALYLLLSPIGFASFSIAKALWAVLNIALVAGATAFMARQQRWSWVAVGFLLAAVFIATPTRTALASGQQTFLVFAMFAAAFHSSRSSVAGVSLAVAITKYSFAPPMLLVLALRRRWSTVGVAAGVSVFAVVVFGVVTSTPIVTAMFQPLAVNQTSVGFGAADLMTLTQGVLSLSNTSLVPYVAGIFGCLVLTFTARRAIADTDWLGALAIGSAISLLCFKHLLYDFVFLIPIAIVATRLPTLARAFALGAVAYFWFAYQAFGWVGISASNPAVTAVSFAVLLLAFTAVVGCWPRTNSPLKDGCNAGH